MAYIAFLIFVFTLTLVIWQPKGGSTSVADTTRKHMDINVQLQPVR